MERGCRYNLNLYCHADGRDKHPIGHPALFVSLLKDQLSVRLPWYQQGAAGGWGEEQITSVTVLQTTHGEGATAASPVRRRVHCSICESPSQDPNLSP